MSPNVVMHIVSSDDKIVLDRPGCLSETEQKFFDAEIPVWLSDDIIKLSCSDNCSSVLLYKKKDSSHNLCVNYLHLNKNEINDQFFLPLINDVIYNPKNSAVFTKLELQKEIFQI